MNERVYLKFLQMMQKDIERIAHDELGCVKGVTDAKSSLVELHYRITNLIRVLEWVIDNDNNFHD